MPNLYHKLTIFHIVFPIFAKHIYPYICLIATKFPIEIMSRVDKVSLFNSLYYFYWRLKLLGSKNFYFFNLKVYRTIFLPTNFLRLNFNCTTILTIF